MWLALGPCALRPLEHFILSDPGKEKAIFLLHQEAGSPHGSAAC